jgi:hypothetical protein
MQILEGRLVRLPCLPKWWVTIAPPKPGEIILPAGTAHPALLLAYNHLDSVSGRIIFP